jgi:hypothetical protein
LIRNYLKCRLHNFITAEDGLPPDDLDPRYFSSASPGLATKGYLAGTEQVLVDGAYQAGLLLFDLPGISPRLTIRRRRGGDDAGMRLDTVIVEPDEEKVALVWRGSLQMLGRLHEILCVSVSL